MSYSIISDPTDNNIYDILGFDAVKKRVYQVTNCTDICGLAEYLGVREAQISDARRKQLFPEEWLKVVARRTKADLCWLIHGKVPKDVVEK